MMNDPYGLLQSGLPPELAARAIGLSRQQMIAQALMDQGMRGPDMPTQAGVRLSPVQGLAALVQTYTGQKLAKEADEKAASLADDRQRMVADAMMQYQRLRDGSPGVSPTTTMDDQGNAMPTSPATPGDPRAAIVMATTNRLLANNPIIAADLKKLEPNWAVHKSYDANGQEQQVLVNLNDPSQIRAFGGSKAVEPKAVETTDANGRPVTAFVNPFTQTTPLPKAVEKKMVDTGKVVVPVDPYAPEPLGKTTTPGEDQSRRTQLQVHGLGPDGMPTGDIREVAKAIAEGRMAPLSSFAMSSPRGQQIMSLVTEFNPNYDVKDFHAADKTIKDFSTGKQGNSVRSFNVALAHLDTLDNLAGAMQNGDVQLANKLANTVATQTGAPAPVQFEAAKKIVGDEIVKAIVGSGGGVADREEAARTISAVSSPAQLRGVINTYKELMRGQLSGLRQQYETSTGRKDFDRFLTDQAKSESGAGVETKTINGKTYVKQNGQWFEQ